MRPVIRWNVKYRIPLSLFLITPVLSVGLFAQNAPKVELFGGFSYLRLAEQTYLSAANLNGWNASGKLNVAPRLGFLADFSGHYGERRLQLPVGSNPSISPEPGEMRQHTFLFGPELRVLTRDRLTVNVRALAGVAHTNTLMFVEHLTFPSANAFAAAFGGSIDYRISDRFSYRIMQPELLLTRFSRSTQPDVRVSTGIMFTFGRL